MRVLWILMALALAFGIWTMWPRPGQHPIEDRPAHWVSTQSVGLYRPRSMMGDTTLSPSSSAGDAKLACVMNASNWVIQ